MSSLIHDPWDCPDPDGIHCEDIRRRILVRSGFREIPGLAPKRESAVGRGDVFPHVHVAPASEGAVSLVDQEIAHEDQYLGGGA